MSETLTLKTGWNTVADCNRKAKLPKTSKIVYSAIARSELRDAKLGPKGPYRIHDLWFDAWMESRATPVEVKR